MKRTFLPAVVIVALISLGLYGCGSPTSEPATSNTPSSTDQHDEHDHAEHDQPDEGGQTDMEKMKAELAKLSPEDAASAEKQHVCPVSGKMLGTMGAPQKIDVNGQGVWICCAGCKDQLLEKPDEYLAKLKQE